MRKLVLSAIVAAGLTAVGGTAQASGGGEPLMKPGFSWEGVFGRYDKGELKRGFEVFHQVCSNCHGLRLVAYRNLAAVGLDQEEIKTVAAERELPDAPNDEGMVSPRPGRPSDKYIDPFPNEKAAASANGGAAPPDLSLMAKARVGGPNYVYSLMLGFVENPPADHPIPEGKYFNTYFPGNAISMPPQLMEDLVTYADGTKATPEQMAKDITAFLNWAAEPELDERKSMGLKVMIFLLVFTAMLYALKRQIWKNIH
ncbi:cytochrome c1 [Magnetospirillum sp. UT-4]|uniref:cytochrome c1 n=1 Tax=Magnetospirillum sp. UT-4 TaxID=2681467 RepID=UPI00138554E0|nr:cytochrome c1 [Magnetospirillum sp. UT-4]CAA7620055.1 Cytochrome c1 [Magnetospirillum sp. UT-4]